MGAMFPPEVENELKEAAPYWVASEKAVQAEFIARLKAFKGRLKGERLSTLTADLKDLKAADNLKRAADQLRTNSGIQDHYGEVLFKLGRYDEAIAAWTRALAGDDEEIDRAGLDKKIRTARQKLKK